MVPLSLSLSILFARTSHCSAAILDDRSACGRGERLALALARENINSVLEGPARARVDVEVFELQKDSQYETTDTSKSYPYTNTLRKRGLRLKYMAKVYRVALFISMNWPYLNREVY